MSAKAKPLQVGDTLACYTILAVIHDATKSNYRRYLARAECCGQDVERNELVFKRAEKVGATRCHRCAQRAANPAKRADYAIGEQFGPVRILGRSETFRVWRVVWDCCGKVAEMDQHYLSVLRTRQAQGRTAVCLECSIKRSRLLAQDREKTPRKPRSKAALAASRGLGAPIRQPRTPIKPLVTPIAAKLPEGIVPAAIAWPRPSVTPSTIAGRTILSRHADARAVTLALTVTHSPDI